MIERQPVLGFAFRDASGTVGTCRFNLRAGTTVAAGHAAGNSLRAVLSGMLDTVPIRQSVVYPVTVDPIQQAWPGSLVENRAALIFETSAPGQLLSVSVPAIRPELIDLAGPHPGLELDVLQVALIDFVQEIINGLWCNPFGYDATELGATLIETVD